MVPSWMDRIFGMYRTTRIRAEIEVAWALLLPLLGKPPVLTEHQAAFSVDRATAWLETDDPALMLEASTYLHGTLQQSLLSGVHPHMRFTNSPVAAGIPDFSR